MGFEQLLSRIVKPRAVPELSPAAAKRYALVRNPDGSFDVVQRVGGGSGPRQATPYARWDPMVTIVPPAALTPIVVGSIAYSNTEFAAGVESLHILASGAATALVDFDLAFEQQRIDGANLGMTLKSIEVVYNVGVVALSGAPTLAIRSVSYPAVAAAAAAPTVTAIDGGSTSNPGTWTGAGGVTGAGLVVTAQIVLGTPYLMSVDLTKVVGRLSFPMANTGTVDIVDVLAHYRVDIAPAG